MWRHHRTRICEENEGGREADATVLGPSSSCAFQANIELQYIQPEKGKWAATRDMGFSVEASICVVLNL